MNDTQEYENNWECTFSNLGIWSSSFKLINTHTENISIAQNKILDKMSSFILCANTHLSVRYLFDFLKHLFQVPEQNVGCLVHV